MQQKLLMKNQSLNANEERFILMIPWKGWDFSRDSNLRFPNINRIIFNCQIREPGSYFTCLLETIFKFNTLKLGKQTLRVRLVDGIGIEKLEYDFFFCLVRHLE